MGIDLQESVEIVSLREWASEIALHSLFIFSARKSLFYFVRFPGLNRSYLSGCDKFFVDV